MIKFFFFRIFNKVYQIEYQTHGKKTHVEYFAMYRWENFSAEKLIIGLANELRLKPSQIRIQSISRVDLSK